MNWTIWQKKSLYGKHVYWLNGNIVNVLFMPFPYMREISCFLLLIKFLWRSVCSLYVHSQALIFSISFSFHNYCNYSVFSIKCLRLLWYMLWALVWKQLSRGFLQRILILLVRQLVTATIGWFQQLNPFLHKINPIMTSKRGRVLLCNYRSKVQKLKLQRDGDMNNVFVFQGKFSYKYKIVGTQSSLLCSSILQ